MIGNFPEFPSPKRLGTSASVRTQRINYLCLATASGHIAPHHLAAPKIMESSLYSKRSSLNGCPAGAVWPDVVPLFLYGFFNSSVAAS